MDKHVIEWLKTQTVPQFYIARIVREKWDYEKCERLYGVEVEQFRPPQSAIFWGELKFSCLSDFEQAIAGEFPLLSEGAGLMCLRKALYEQLTADFGSPTGTCPFEMSKASGVVSACFQRQGWRDQVEGLVMQERAASARETRRIDEFLISKHPELKVILTASVDDPRAYVTTQSARAGAAP